MRNFKGNSCLRSAQWEAEGDKKQALEWYLLSAKCFLNTVQYTGRDMVHAPWGYHLNRTDEMRRNWLNSSSVLMTSLWEPKSSSVETGAIHQTLTSALWPLRAWHRQPIRREGCVLVITASRIQPLTRHGLQWPQQQWDVNRRLCGWSRRIRKTLVLETKRSLILLELLSWLPFSTYRFSGYGSPVAPISSYIHWRPLNTAAELILSSQRSDYTLCRASLAVSPSAYPSQGASQAKEKLLLLPKTTLISFYKPVLRNQN